ncbi:MAG: heavy-metal-associated domain-containing protein [Candidatus Anstonellales archaeon]
MKNCCTVDKKDSKRGLLRGLVYGLIPHTGCMLFILAAVFGATAASAFFQPLLSDPNFFYILIALSFVFATFSALLYLRKYNLLSFSGLRKEWKYLSTLYATTVSVNLLFIFFLFPFITTTLYPTQSLATQSSSILQIKLAVNIPCSGHAPLIIEELKKLDGIKSVSYEPPNLFLISYDPNRISKKDILSVEVFKTYPTNVLEVDGD